MMSETLQKLHLTAAEAMIEVFADKINENAEEIAFHFEKANYDLKAAEYFSMAGKYFYNQYIFDKAEENFSKLWQSKRKSLIPTIRS